MPGLRDIALVALGGAIGTVGRFLVSYYSAKVLGSAFPWGTLFVNLAGCFAYGLGFALIAREFTWSPEARLFFLTGFLGGLTTFSSFGMETVLLGAGGSGYLAAANVVVNNLGGLALAALGLHLGKLL